jgi:uncharacterized protein (DUF433 family)
MVTNIRINQKRKSLGFYSPQEAARIACIPNWTINDWKRTGIFIPTIKWIDEQNKEHLGYNFEAVVFMRLIRNLRSKGVSLYKAVDAMSQLKKRFKSPSQEWAKAKIFVDKKDAYVYDERDKDSWGITMVTRFNQRVDEYILGKEFILLKDRADALLIPEQFMNFVEIDTSIQNGLPIIRDSKILTSTVHYYRSQEYSNKDIQEMYPFIALDKIIGAEEYETYLDKVILN